MFKSEHYDEFKGLLSNFDWEKLLSNPNSDSAQDWVASIHGILWEFDSPSANDFQKKIDSFVNMWGGVNAGTLPNYDLSHDLNDIKQFLRIKAEGMRRLKGNLPTGPIGILNKGKDNVFDSNTFSGMGVGIVDEGQRTKASDNKFQNDRPSSQNFPKLMFGNSGKNGQGGGGGSVFIQAEHFNIIGNGKISADGGDSIVDSNLARGQNSAVNINYGTINEQVAGAVKSLTELMKLIGESQLKENEKMQLIGNAEIVKASIIQPQPDKTTLQKAWEGMQAASTIGGAVGLIQTIGAIVLPLLK